MYYFKKSYISLILLITINLFITPIFNVKATNNQELTKEIERLKEENRKLKERIFMLEPETPKEIIEPRYKFATFPSKIYPIQDVIESGEIIPFESLIDKPNYIRPIYELHWHSTIGRWSKIPNRIQTAQHRLFTHYDIGLSSWYDFEHEMGLDIPMYQNKQALDLYLVTFQTEVTKIYTKGNQVVIVGFPRRKGVQVNTITTKDIHRNNTNEGLLIQLVTPDGYEIDYSLESYVEPDYWAKIRKN